MKDSLDPRVDMMVASLYGELSAEDEARFRRMLLEDPVLRAEWNELRETRQTLGAWELAEPVPSFVLMGGSPAGKNPRTEESGGFWQRLRAGWARYSTATGWTLAAAAILLAVLALAEFRIDLLDRGVAFRFGPPTASRLDERPVDQTPDQVSPVDPGDAGTRRSGDSWMASGNDSTRVQLTRRAGDPAAPITWGEFDGYATAMAKVLAAMQSRNEYNGRENEEFVAFMRTMYDGLTQKQSQDYYDLRGRIEAVRYGLTEVQTNTNDRFDSIDLQNGESLTPEAERRADGRQSTRADSSAPDNGSNH